MAKDTPSGATTPARTAKPKAAVKAKTIMRSANSAARAVKKTREDSFPIVAIGMSAGGLEAATQFLHAMPIDSGAGFVIVQHLEPVRKSLLAELLSRQTKMPVVDIEDGMRVKPNRVHVIIPAKTLLIKDGVFSLIEPDEARAQRHPIDHFFTSLAAERGAKAVAIVLTGAGSNGSAGLLDIKQEGGLGIAQDPETASFDSMPRHAIAANAVDYVLPIAKMPEALMAYFAHSYVKDAPEAIEPTKGGKASLDDVLTLIRSRSGHDFRQYKRNTLARRTHRRMGLMHIEKLDEYVATLRSDPEELAALTSDLMINVTGFFRDPDAWDALEREAIKPIVDKAEPGQHIRVWVPACSTGEEAYSIAMLLAERCEAAGKGLGVKVFGTDLADHNLTAARKGLYPASMVESLSPERLKRFFDKSGDIYQVKSDIRETVLFASQNLLSDPPYSKMDLVSCRNLLIYLEPAAQDKVLSLAHFALREGGYLFLGNSETIGTRDHHFATMSKRWRIYRRLGPSRSSAIDFSAWPARDARADQRPAGPKVADIAIRSLAERFAPAAVVIDRNYRIHHFHGVTDDYLAQPAGAPTLDLMELARDGLRMAIRRTVSKAISEGKAVTIDVARGPNGARVAVTADPLPTRDDIEPLFLVTFVAAEGATPSPARTRKAAKVSERDPSADFEAELKAARDELRGTTEQFETANEELKAANEEITSVNEELQATNEELEASKEELQSLNEELNAVNSQLERKLAELEESGDDLRNLLAGSDIATIFLDERMRIKWFTPAIQSLFDLLEQDVGRPLANFAQKFGEVGLAAKAEAAIAKLATFEEEVRGDDGRCFSLRVKPYRTRDNRIVGAVASFVDISDLRTKQNETMAARDYAEAIVRTVRDPLIVLTSDFTVVSANPAYYKIFDKRPADVVGRGIFEIGGGRWDTPRFRQLIEEMLPTHGQIDDFDVEFDVPALGKRQMLINARRIPGKDGRPALILIAQEDVTERKDLERHQHLLVSELSHRVKNTLAVVHAIATNSLRGSTTLEQFSEAFLGRIEALGRAHDMVLKTGLLGIQLGSIVDQALKPFQTGGQIEIVEGPSVELGQAASQSLTMILHELATNAIKYGALSISVGKVAIDWRVDPNGGAPRAALRWTESGGPAAAPPERHGHGIRFIERSTSYELRGKADLAFDPGGLRAAFDFPLQTQADDAH